MNVVKCVWLIKDSHGSWPLPVHELKALPLTMRRRLTPLGRQALEVVNGCAAGVAKGEIPWVISCRHGDKSRRFNLLSSLAKGEMLSPSEFSMSVHNAIIGLFSIATKNRQSHHALASGKHSFEAGLVESIALLKEKGGAVGYLYYDYLDRDSEGEPFQDNAPVECFAMILAEGEGELNVEYYINNNSFSKFNIYELTRYLDNNYEERFGVPVGGGEILFKRTLSKD